jgi:hypothetical protein
MTLGLVVGLRRSSYASSTASGNDRAGFSSLVSVVPAIVVVVRWISIVVRWPSVVVTAIALPAPSATVVIAGIVVSTTAVLPWSAIWSWGPSRAEAAVPSCDAGG